MSGWGFERLQGTAGALHGLGLPERPERSVRVLEVDGPALVLGSTQAESTVDRPACVARGVEVARRRSGGGAVLLEPGRVVWVDVVVPAGDPLWCDDVGRSFHWLGLVWAGALAALGGAGARVHTAALVRTRWSPLVCFAGLGAGEVMIEGAKAVGMSQRRSRAGALFQCAVPLAWAAPDTVALLALTEADRRQAATDLERSVWPLHGVAPAAVVDALRSTLPH